MKPHSQPLPYEVSCKKEKADPVLFIEKHFPLGEIGYGTSKLDVEVTFMITKIKRFY